jgi:K+-transporting ATPase ATPase C chain
MGSELIAQNFFSNQYFHPRPSSAGKNGYDATASSASNLSVTSKSLIDTVALRTNQYRELNHMSQNQSVPVDAVLGSGSGLDPHITVSNAIRQAPRVAKARDMNIEEALNLINACIEKPFLGFMGEKRVNIMRLNALLDKNSSIIKK